MEELLQNPAVQAGVLPFIAGLVLAAFLRNTRQLGLAIAVGFVCAVGLTVGLGFESLTSVKKLVLTVIGAAVLGVVLESMTSEPRWSHRLVVIVALSVAVLWMLQRILVQRDAAGAALAGAAAILYCVALLAGGERTSRDPVSSAAAALVLALATGALALLGASAQLAQLGIAVGAASGAVLLVQMLAGASAPVGWTLALSAQVAAALIGLLAVFTGSLPWYCLLPLAFITWAAKLAPGAAWPVWRRAVVTVLFAIVPALIAIALAWFTSGGQAA